jgi:hypothetical protein
LKLDLEELLGSGHSIPLVLDNKALVIPYLKISDVKVSLDEENMETILLEGTSKNM